ncbi:MAG TPA: tail fiber protein [Rhizomicrobium sp.]
MRRSLFIATTALAGLLALPTLAEEPTIGSIAHFPAPNCPAGWHVTDGTLMPIKDNWALFTVLGKSRGGDGQRTFALQTVRSSPIDGVPVVWCVAMQGRLPPEAASLTRQN